MTLGGKFDRLAPGFSDSQYADTAYYNRRRADAVFASGPPLPAGATVLDLGCGDASFADEVLRRGYRYIGVDASPGMCEVAAARLRGRGLVAHGDYGDYTPSLPVDMTVLLRLLYLIEDRVSLLQRIGAYTRVKVVFDAASSQVDLAAVEADVRTAGFAGFARRPMLVSMRYAPPRPVDLALRALEHTGPVGLSLATRRARVACAAYDFRGRRSTSLPSYIDGSSSSGT